MRQQRGIITTKAEARKRNAATCDQMAAAPWMAPWCEVVSIWIRIVRPSLPSCSGEACGLAEFSRKISATASVERKPARQALRSSGHSSARHAAPFEAEGRGGKRSGAWRSARVWPVAFRGGGESEVVGTQLEGLAGQKRGEREVSERQRSGLADVGKASAAEERRREQGQF